MKKLYLLLIFGCLAVPARVSAAEAEVIQVHEAPIPVELVVADPVASEAVSEDERQQLPMTGGILQMGLTFTGTLMIGGSLLWWLGRGGEKT